jgi:glucuronokinase
MSALTTVVPARAGLVGQPSDAFAGAVLATPVRELAATIAVEASDHFVVGDQSFPDLASLLETAHEGESMLLTAAIARLASWMRDSGAAPPEKGFRMTWQTTIPRSAGLAGSSALVIGALRSLAALWDVAITDELGPRLALEVEVDLLGIAAGPQDRLVQWHQSTLLMDFAATSWSVRAVRPPVPIDLVICWTDTAHRPSHATHAPLQARRDDPDVREHMADLAVLAREATAALETGDLDRLGQCMNTGFEHRRSLMPLDPENVDLVERLRAVGWAATYAGSGGAVVALGPEPARLRRWATERGLKCITTTTS